MPCFKGLAVSIHTPEGPLPEYSIQRQARASRISSYIPVPPPTISAQTKELEQSTFAISITLLTPGLQVPYSALPTATNPFPIGRRVGGLPSSFARGHYDGVVGPYIPLTSSPNETVAAYIYFDGREKEEVATLLRRGEETWVNSRWVSVPESEGGGLAEREFLFREVGLERWLNGLDLSGTGAAAQVEKRRLRLRGKQGRRERREREAAANSSAAVTGSRDPQSNSTTAYKNHSELAAQGPQDRDLERRLLEQLVDSESESDQSSDSDGSNISGDNDPIPESTGQIKIALYRVLASGDIRKGEYSPQFDAHDGDDGLSDRQGNEAPSQQPASLTKEDVDHTTSFAKPKSLDPTTISTQTVTGIDAHESPFAVFTFLYRGEKQLQKMGILPSATQSGSKDARKTEGNRRSMQDELAKLKPLDSSDLKRFSEMRDPNQHKGQKKKDKLNKGSCKVRDENSDDDDAVAADDIVIKMEDPEGVNVDAMLSPEDVRQQSELADAVQKIKLKRRHSADLSDVKAAQATKHSDSQKRHDFPHTAKQASSSSFDFTGSTRPTTSHSSEGPLLPAVSFSNSFKSTTSTTSSSNALPSEVMGSPLKRARSNIPADSCGTAPPENTACNVVVGEELHVPGDASVNSGHGVKIGKDVLGLAERDTLKDLDPGSTERAPTQATTSLQSEANTPSTQHANDAQIDAGLKQSILDSSKEEEL